MPEFLRKTGKEIVLPMSIVIALISLAFWVGIIANKVEATEKKDSPSRDEFRELSKDIRDIKNYLMPVR